ncbi:hypothetical protein L1276_003467 [Flavobacterium sp. HSC-32F16]|uniref:YfbM family protein n=1 Tax=Flavobacterium sp. HSC-32F16 TaxID=2910964 RepID=UPI0020A33A6B|nr:YfbM family protein [Flavobacterium sp. HSC-32F16]MCP2028297.1 hypothetical protein [Flavobacterium sp. HSC-32F16]
MGMIAEYLMVNDEILDSLMELNNEDLVNEIFEIEESEKFPFIDIDKIWDAVHCFLTGVSATEPIEGNKLSEAIVGVHNFNIEDEEADFVACTENEELPEIIAELEKIDFNRLASNFDPIALKKLYPSGIWKQNKEELITEFKTSVDELLKFYKKALETKHHIIVSIL